MTVIHGRRLFRVKSIRYFKHQPGVIDAYTAGISLNESTFQNAQRSLSAGNITVYKTTPPIFTLSPVNWAYNSLQEPELQVIKF
jgi:hypothetical protein